MTKGHTALGPSDAFRVFVAPASVYKKVEDTGAYGWPLAAVLIGVALIGYIQIQTGLLDRVVDLDTQRRLAEFETSQRHLLDRARFDDGMEALRKQGEFSKTIRHLQVLLLGPAGLLASYMLVAAVLYALVALSGRKPEYHTLMSVCVYAGFVDLLARALEAGMMIAYRTPYVDTSLAMLAPPGQSTPLAAANPIVMWYWALVAIGLIVTRQLGKRSAIVACSVMCVASLALRVAATYAQV